MGLIIGLHGHFAAQDLFGFIVLLLEHVQAGQFVKQLGILGSNLLRLFQGGFSLVELFLTLLEAGLGLVKRQSPGVGFEALIQRGRSRRRIFLV